MAVPRHNWLNNSEVTSITAKNQPTNHNKTIPRAAQILKLMVGNSFGNCELNWTKVNGSSDFIC